MKNLKQAANVAKRSWNMEILFPLFLFVFVAVAAVAAGKYFDYTSNMQSIDLLRQSARRAVVQCYAIEGTYPDSVEYLEKRYGLDYNHDKYFIDYEVFASNVMPNVEVYEKK